MVYSDFRYFMELSEKGAFEYFRRPDHKNNCHMINERPYAN